MNAAKNEPAFRRYTVGDIAVTVLSDGFLTIGAESLAGIEADEFADRLKAAHIAGDQAPTGVNAFLIETGGETILLDTGTGGIMGETLGHVGAGLAAIGVAPGAISKVIASHLHPDHIGGVLKEGKNQFGEASFLVSEAERAFWTDEAMAAAAPEPFKPFFDLANTVLTSFGDRLQIVTGEATLAPGLTAVPMPGHTPGHMGVRVESGGDQLLIWADIVHVGAVQFARPEVTIGFDADAAQAAATRAKVMDMVATDDLRIAGTHIDFPGTGHLERRGAGYAWVASGYPYGQ